MFGKTKTLHLVSLFKSLLDSVISVYLYVLGTVLMVLAFGLHFDYKMLTFSYTFFILTLILSRISSILIKMYKDGTYNRVYSLVKLTFSFLLIMRLYTSLDNVNPIRFVKTDSVYLTSSYFIVLLIMLLLGSKILSKLITNIFEKLYYDHPEDFHLKNISYVYSEISGNLLHELYSYELKGINFFSLAHVEFKNDFQLAKLQPTLIGKKVEEEPESETIIITKDFEEEEKG